MKAHFICEILVLAILLQRPVSKNGYIFVLSEYIYHFLLSIN